MRNINLVAAIASMLTGVGIWATSTTQARSEVPAKAAERVAYDLNLASGILYRALALH